MKCRFCFATFQDVRRTVLPKGHLNREDSIQVVRTLVGEAGFRKINFAGGEPFLCPWLPELVEVAKESGAATSVITNGSLLTEATLEAMPGLDWLALSIDSLNKHALLETGRAVGGHRTLAEQYLALCYLARSFGVKLKINTVVNATNYQEDMTSFIKAARPVRWKLLQMLAMENDADDLLINQEQFDTFVRVNQVIESSRLKIVPETSQQQVGSYAMVDPAGRFYDNVDGKYTYSSPILKVGVAAAMSAVRMNRAAFLQRGGSYDYAGSKIQSLAY
jgi:radical S-adenosyl methionine domain-containing protein 2